MSVTVSIETVLTAAGSRMSASMGGDREVAVRLLQVAAEVIGAWLGEDAEPPAAVIEEALIRMALDPARQRASVGFGRADPRGDQHSAEVWLVEPAPVGGHGAAVKLEAETREAHMTNRNIGAVRASNDAGAVSLTRPLRFRAVSRSPGVA